MHAKQLVISGVVMLAGCGAPAVAPLASDGGGSGSAQTVQARLEQADGPLSLVVVPFDSSGTVQGRRTLVDSQDVTLPLQVTGGMVQVALAPDGQSLVIQAAHLRVADVVLSPDQLPPNGLTFHNLALELKAPMQARAAWLAGGVEGVASLTGDFELTGELQTADGTSPFEPQEFAGVTVSADLTTDSFDDVQLRFRVHRSGVTWQWQGLLQTNDFELDGRALEDSPPPHE